MKKNLKISLTAAMLLMLCGCREEPEQAAIPPLQQIDTAPTRTASVQTYTGTTVDFYYGTTTRGARMASASGGLEMPEPDTAMVPADTAAALPDFDYGLADTAAAETVSPDMAIVETAAPDLAAVDMILPDNVVDTMDTQIVSADTAYN